MTEQSDLIAALAAERKIRGLSLVALGETFGVSGSSIHEWENGVHVPTLTSLQAWAGALGFDVTLAQPEEPEKGAVKYIDYLLYVCNNCNAEVMKPCRDLPAGAVHIARARSLIRASIEEE